VDDRRRLGAPLGRPVVLGDVVEADPVAVAAGRRQRGQQLGVDARALDRERRRGVPERADPPRRRAGSTCSSLASARMEVSSMPAIDPPAAVRSPTATATASASSSSSGGSSAPAPSR
jgi:hypothetical protein